MLSIILLGIFVPNVVVSSFLDRAKIIVNKCYSLDLSKAMPTTSKS